MCTHVKSLSDDFKQLNLISNVKIAKVEVSQQNATIFSFFRLKMSLIE